MGALIAGSGTTTVVTMRDSVARDMGINKPDWAWNDITLFDGPTATVTNCRFEASEKGIFYIARASATVVNCHFEGIEQDRGAIASITQGSVFTLTSSTIISRTTFESAWGSERRRSLFFFDDGFEGVLQLVLSLEQVQALPMAVLEITDTQITSACRTYSPDGTGDPPGVYPTIFAHKNNPSSDGRLMGGGPYSLRGTTITLENCTGNDFAATFGLEPSATATCATNSICGVEAECEDSPMFVDAVTGAVSV
jgi:hypothetical protein